MQALALKSTTPHLSCHHFSQIHHGSPSHVTVSLKSIGIRPQICCCLHHLLWNRHSLISISSNLSSPFLPLLDSLPPSIVSEDGEKEMMVGRVRRSMGVSGGVREDGLGERER
ncbi:unnamed protein product [Camellia sinensis]